MQTDVDVMTIADLIAALQKKEQDMPVEFIICKADGQIVMMDVAKQAKPMQKALRLFK